jgi:hypothetical protein
MEPQAALTTSWAAEIHPGESSACFGAALHRIIACSRLVLLPSTALRLPDNADVDLLTAHKRLLLQASAGRLKGAPAASRHGPAPSSTRIAV